MVFFFFNDTATTEIYTLSLHDALPISGVDEGDVHVSFYTDFNEDGERTVDLLDPFAYEYKTDSEDFWVMKKKVRTFRTCLQIA